jgi:uncharacterized protein (TIGR03086 family)
MLTVVGLDRRAVGASVAVVSAARPADLDRPTPCAGWCLADLLAHMTAQHRGFAAAARGTGADPRVWVEHPLGAGAATAYRAAADDVLAAFAAGGVLDRAFTLPGIGRGPDFPAAQAIGFHLVDYAVHGWDVARTLDLPYRLDADVAAAALRVALAVPDGEARRAPGAAFAPSRPAPEGASDLDRVLAALGRYGSGAA